MAKVRLSEQLINSTRPNPAKQILLWSDNLPGFGLCVSRAGVKSFVIQRHNKRIVVGRHGPHAYSLAAARVEAMKRMSELTKERSGARRKYTLAQGKDLYAQGMRKRNRAARSVDEFEKIVDRYFSPWMQRDITTITRKEVVDRHALLGKRHGHYAANSAFRCFRAIYNLVRAMDDKGTMPDNPCVALKYHWFHETRRRDGVGDLAAYYAKVMALDNPIRKAYRLAILFTGLRATDCATIKLTEINWQDATLYRPMPKSKRPFTIPLSRFTMVVFRYARLWGRHVAHKTEYLFPSHDADGKRTHLKQPRQAKLASPHRSRNTYISAAHAAGVDTTTVKVLVNHALPESDVTEGYLTPEVERLRSAQETVSTYLLRRTGR